MSNTHKYTLINPHLTDPKAIIEPYMSRGTSKAKKYLHMTADTELGLKAGLMLNAGRLSVDLIAISLAVRVGVANLDGIKEIGPLEEATLKTSIANYLNLSGDKDERLLDASKPFRVFLKPIYVGISAGTMDTEKVRAHLEDGTITNAVVEAFQKQTGLLVNTSDYDYMSAVTNLIAWTLAPYVKGLFQTDFAAKEFAVKVDADEFNILSMTESGQLAAAAKKKAQKEQEAFIASLKAQEAALNPPMEAADISGDGSAASDFIQLDENGNPVDPDAVNLDGGAEVSDDVGKSDDAAGNNGPTLN